MTAGFIISRILAGIFIAVGLMGSAFAVWRVLAGDPPYDRIPHFVVGGFVVLTGVQNWKDAA